MNPSAYDIIGRYRLPGPRLYTLDDLTGLDCDDRVYLRFSQKSKRDNRVVAVRDILSHRTELEKSLRSGRLLYIEATYRSTGGGASLVKNGFIYTEYVTGHLIALLRRGRCAARILSQNGLVESIVRTHQGEKAEQGIGYQWSTALVPSTDDITGTIEEVTKLLRFDHPGLLLEWMKTDEGIVFCDAKTEGMEGFGNRLATAFSGSSTVLVSGDEHESLASVASTDGFNIDARLPQTAGQSTCAVDGAILSHFVTRSALNGSTVIMKVNENERNRSKSCHLECGRNSRPVAINGFHRKEGIRADRQDV